MVFDVVTSSYLAAAEQNARDGRGCFDRSLLWPPCANAAMVAMATIPNTQAAIFMTRLCNAAAGDAESRRIPCRPGSEAWNRKHLPAPAERGPTGPARRADEGETGRGQP